ncbi:hypothetical protein [Parvibacter caecicola]|uniref:hypothetical protein n=3 Tax=Parvibacter caecicola TaxID=747645 RepID=UPI00272FF8D7|nr:hypothetical protein [Parvibacter caecicola]
MARSNKNTKQNEQKPAEVAPEQQTDTAADAEKDTGAQDAAGSVSEQQNEQKPAEVAPEQQTDTAADAEKDADDSGEPGYHAVKVVHPDPKVGFINLRDAPVDGAWGEIDHPVAVGTQLKAVENMGEWTRLTHDLYVLSEFVTPL